MSYAPSLYIYTHNYSTMNDYQRLVVDKEIHRMVQLIVTDEIEYQVSLTKAPIMEKVAESIVATLIKTGVYTTNESKVSETKRMPKIFIDGNKMSVNGDLFIVSGGTVTYRFNDNSISQW